MRNPSPAQEASINLPTSRPAPFEVFDLKPPSADIQKEVIQGLKAPAKRLHPKYFYDKAGSELFEAITDLPEYYLTRTELSIFDDNMSMLSEAVVPGGCVVEYGSGSSLKIRKVLNAVTPAAYVPVDISGAHMVAMARSLAEDYPDLAIYPTCADFTGVFELPPPVAGMPKSGFFPGSSIGNFTPDDAAVFLAQVAATLGPTGRLIIGVDLKKEPAILEAAYDDAAGVTAAFNLNLLSHLAAVLGVDLDPERFSHRAHYDPELGAIQMFLDVNETHEVQVGGEVIRFEAGESIHTENSFKYEPGEFLRLAEGSGWTEVRTWTDEKDWFAVFLLEVAQV